MAAPADTVGVRKLHGFAVLGPQANAVAAQKLHGFVVLHDPAVAPVPVETRPARRILGMKLGGFG
jgi:hypothetical protein